MTAYLTRPTRPALAYKYRPGRGPTIVFLPGWRSDMEGTKALAIDAWAAREGRAMLRFDYSGCGLSEGRFEDGTLALWRDDALDTIAAFAANGPLIVIGSSMGGWLALLVTLALPERVQALIGIAAAPDFTDWGFSDEQVEAIRRDGQWIEPSTFSDEPDITSLAFWESGQALGLLGDEIGYDGPVRLLHGQCDEVVPVSIALRLSRALRSADVQTILVKDGDHRLSRDQDIALLIATLSPLFE